MLDRLKKKARRFFVDCKGSHDWEHTVRVYRLAAVIAKKEKANLRIVEYASLLHDIGRPAEDRSRGAKDHALLGARMAGTWLKSEGMDPGEIGRIVDCIRTHRFRGDRKPGSLEAKVLFDADKLDSIGAIGVGRAFLFAGEVGAKLHNKDADISRTKGYSSEDTAWREYSVKLRFVKDRLMTRTGRKIAAARHRFMTGFFNRLNREVDGIE